MNNHTLTISLALALALAGGVLAGERYTLLGQVRADDAITITSYSEKNEVLNVFNWIASSEGDDDDFRTFQLAAEEGGYLVIEVTDLFGGLYGLRELTLKRGDGSPIEFSVPELRPRPSSRPFTIRKPVEKSYWNFGVVKDGEGGPRFEFSPPKPVKTAPMTLLVVPDPK